MGRAVGLRLIQTIQPTIPAGALLERPELLMLLSAGALAISGGTLAALHLLLQPKGVGKRRGQASSAAVEEEEEQAEEAAALEAIARYDLERPLEEELALALSDPEPEEEGKNAQPPLKAQAGGAPAGEYTHPNGKKLSRRARSRHRRQEQLVGPPIEVWLVLWL